MILTVEDLLKYIISIGRTIETFDLDEEAKTAVFIREAGKVIKQAEEAEHGTD